MIIHQYKYQNKMNFTPLGPPTHKKPKPKEVRFVDDLFGYVSADEFLEAGTQIYAVNDEGEFQLVETGTYILENGYELDIEDGVIC